MGILKNIDYWKQEYLKDKGIININLSQKDIDRARKIVYYLRSNRNFIFLLTQKLSLTKELINGIIFYWVDGAEKGYTIIDSLSMIEFSSEDIGYCVNSAFLIIRYEPTLDNKNYKTDYLITILMKRLINNYPTLIEFYSKATHVKDIHLVKNYPSFETMISSKDSNTKVFLIV